jgi:hypothetical protein
MTAPARYSPAKSSTDGAFDDTDELHELVPGDRIGSPVAGTDGRAMLGGVVVILILLGGGWALLGDQLAWLGWPPAETAAVSPAMGSSVLAPIEPAASAMAIATTPTGVEPTKRSTVPDAKPSTLQQSGSNKTAAASAAASSLSPLTTAALPSVARGFDDPAALPLRSPTADPADPYQMRAVAVGLHPGLSRVLLARLSPTDYRNAGIAIQTAMAEKLDSSVFVWPRQPKPKLALFQVRFVPGAAPGCRRYVVTVAKDGWLTTAPPMEKCGSQSGRLGRE